MELEEHIINKNLARINMLGTKCVKARYKTCCQLHRLRRRELKNIWELTKAAELRTFADSNDPKGFNQRIENYEVWSRLNYSGQLQAIDNETVITDKHDLLAKWEDHFATLINEPSTVEQLIVDKIKQGSAQYWLCKCPTLDEMSTATKSLLAQTDYIQKLLRVVQHCLLGSFPRVGRVCWSTGLERTLARLYSLVRQSGRVCLVLVTVGQGRLI